MSEGAEPIDPRIARSRARVIEAATRLLVEQGPRAVTADAIAERSGVAKSTIYRHWPSISHLLADVLRANIPSPPPIDPDARFEEALRSTMHSFAAGMADPEWVLVITAIISLRARIPELAELLTADLDTKTAIVEQLLAQGAAEGVLPAGLDARQATRLLAGPMLLAALLGEMEDSAAVADESVDAFLRLHRIRST